jgi:hypothetical protein
MATKTKTFKVRNQFPPGFKVAYATMVIAMGRLEYELQLAFKSLHGGGLERAPRDTLRSCSLGRNARTVFPPQEPSRRRILVHSL